MSSADQRARSSCLRAAFECAFGYTRACSRSPIPHSRRFAMCATGPRPDRLARARIARVVAQEGCTEAVMLAYGFTTAQMVEL